MGSPVKKAVVAVPANFNYEQRKEIKEVGTKAGLEVLRVINEPTSVCMAYDMHKSTEDKKVLVFDMGAALDLTILNVEEGIFEIIGTSRSTVAGGHKADELLLQYSIDQFQSINKVDLKNNPRAVRRLLL